VTSAGDPLRDVRALAEALGTAASTDATLEALARLHVDLTERLRRTPTLGTALAVTVSASGALARTITRHPAALDVLADLHLPGANGHRPGSSRLDSSRLDSSRPDPDFGVAGGHAATGDPVADAELGLLRIAARDLLGLDRLEEVGAALTARAAAVFSGALARSGLESLAVIAMGKAGGAELNYSSDVDVLLVADEPVDDRAVRRLLGDVRRCFRVDLDLRPEGRAGPMVRTLDAYREYWARWAEPWEIQALLKATPLAGPDELGQRFALAAAEALWARTFGREEIARIRELKSRAEELASRQRPGEVELKRAPGGLRDIEFAVQLLQLVHGRADPALRTPNTLAALAELGAGGYVAPADAWSLAESYRFLRLVEHRLQLAELQQVHRVPADTRRRAVLARSLGYGDDGWASALERFDTELARVRLQARQLHERLWFRPLLYAFAVPAPAAGAGERARLVDGAPGGAPGGRGRHTLAADAALTRLAAFGFGDTTQAQIALEELTRGLGRTSRLLQQLMPLVLGWLSDSPDPDAGLTRLRRLVGVPLVQRRLTTTWRDAPDAARRLCRLLGTSAVVADTLVDEPDLLETVATDAVDLPSSAELATTLARSLEWRPDAQRWPTLRRLRRRERTRIAVADLLGFLDLAATGRALARLDEAVLAQALEITAPDAPWAVIALGRLGGAELSFASDLDLVLVGDAEGHEAARLEDAARRLLRHLKGSTPADQILPVDLSLRPEGRVGRLVPTLRGLETYLERWAAPWERQALLRARPIAGREEVAVAAMQAIGGFVGGRGLSEPERREIRRLKARMERERIPPSDDPQFHLKLGRGSLSDVEWTVQLLELEVGLREPSTLRALDLLVTRGVLPGEDGEALREAYVFCESVRNRAYLVTGRPADALPSRPEVLGTLSRSFGKSPAELREDYRRVTRRARRVMDRRFWGRSVGPESG